VKALPFYRDILGLDIIIDEVVDKDETNTLLNLKPGSKTHLVFLKGDHFFGKVVITEPLNYGIPDLVSMAVPPNIGYLAMSFPVEALESVEARCKKGDLLLLSSSIEIDLPALGKRRAMIVKTPGSGALTQLYEDV
jgi:hypothetical protein